MKFVTSATNALRGLQKLSADEKYVIKADGSGLQKMSAWQSFKNFLGTKGAIRENRATIEALKGLIRNDATYSGASAELAAQLDKLSARGLAVSGKFIKTMFASLNARANLDVVRKTVASRLATILAEVSEGGEKTLLQERLDKAYGYLTDSTISKKTFQAALKKCVESQLTNELAQNLSADGTLPEGKNLSNVRIVLARVLEDVLAGMENVQPRDRGQKLLARLNEQEPKKQKKEYSAFEKSLAGLLHRGNEVGFSTEASFGFSPPEALLNHEALKTFNVSNEAFSRVYTLERQLGKTDEDIEKALVDPGGIPNLLRLAHNPQFLTDRTAYLKGKAILADPKKSGQITDGMSGSWHKTESNLKKTGFFKRMTNDSDLQKLNGALADRMGLDKAGAPYKALLSQMMLTSAQRGYVTFCKRLASAERYHIGPRPQDGDRSSVHLSDPLMAGRDYALGKQVNRSLLDAIVRVMTDPQESMSDWQKAVFVSRVFNPTTLDHLENKQSGEDALKEVLQGFRNEAKEIVDEFGENNQAQIEAFCRQQNFSPDDMSLLQNPLSREQISALKQQVQVASAWADGISKRGRSISAEDFKKLNEGLLPHATEDGTQGLVEFSLGMVKTMGCFKAGNKSGWKTLLKPADIEGIFNAILLDYFTKKEENVRDEGLVGVVKGILNDEDMSEVEDELLRSVHEKSLVAMKSLQLLSALTTAVFLPVCNDESVEDDALELCMNVHDSGCTTGGSMLGEAQTGKGLKVDKGVLAIIRGYISDRLD